MSVRDDYPNLAARLDAIEPAGAGFDFQLHKAMAELEELRHLLAEIKTP